MLKKIAILTSGGDAPGMNAAIRAVARSAINSGLEVYGIYDGYKGLVEDRMFKLDREILTGIMVRGGTFLGTVRLPEFKDKEVRAAAIANMKNRGIDALVVIGGDGTFRGAQALSRDCHDINFIGIPGTIDNDINGTDYTIGFDTALSTVVEAIDKIRDTSASHHRCSVIEVMGNHCGDLATLSGLAAGAEILIIPELPYNEEDVINKLNYYHSIGKRHAIIVACEKIVNVQQLAARITKETLYDTRATILGHIQRGGSPSPRDRILATMMGEKAVDLLIHGVSGHCIGIDNEVIISLPIDEALSIKKDNMSHYYRLFDKLI